MKVEIMLMSIVAIVVFAVGANAQQTGKAKGHVKVFDGRNAISLARIDNSTKLPVVDLPAGKSLRVGVGVAASDERYVYVFVGSPARISAPQIPCSRIERGGHGNDVLLGSSGDDLLIAGSTAYQEVRLREVYVTSWQTSAGTCRLLNVKFANGEQHRAAIRFR